MCKIVVYGKGRVFEKNYHSLDKVSIIAIVDQNAKADETFDSIPVFLPDEIKNMKYDYIVVFTEKYFNEIFSSLVGNYFVEKNKIILWSSYLFKPKLISKDVINILKEVICEQDIESVLCARVNELQKYFMNKSQLGLSSDVILDEFINSCEDNGSLVFDNRYKEIEQCNKEYDLVVGTAEIFDYDVLNIWKTASFFIMTPVASPEFERMVEIKDEISKDRIVKEFIHANGIIWLIKKTREYDNISDASIYVVSHKKYNVLSDDLYAPICVGKEFINKEWLSDLTGDNIAYLNEKINECTALYWIWKNTSNNIVGLNHYRRYFYSDNVKCFGNFLNKREIKDIMEDYDIILEQAEPFYNVTVKEQLIASILDKEAYEKGFHIISKLIKEKQPDYIEAFEAVFNGHIFYKCNMFVTKRDILNQYCEWLFSFIIDAAEMTDITGYDDYSKRIIGFLAERMLTVWLYKNKLKIKELPISVW